MTSLYLMSLHLVPFLRYTTTSSITIIEWLDANPRPDSSEDKNRFSDELSNSPPHSREVVKPFRIGGLKRLDITGGRTPSAIGCGLIGFPQDPKYYFFYIRSPLQR
jgi:hypothetical protein